MLNKEDLIDKVKALAIEKHDFLISTRRHLHQYPELSFREYETSKFLKNTLEALELGPVGVLAETGLCLILEGNGEGETIALRADIDALPITEKEGRAYGSKNQGVMHACGHDVHSTCLLGALLILKDLKSHWNGKIKAIFQPGEEKAPGGASIMIEEGILNSPAVDAILGQHVMPLLPVGTVGFRPGKYMASADEIYIKITGKGGHAAMPYKLNDPVLAMAHLITGLQHIVSRRANASIPSVLSFGKVIAQGATNIIPHEVLIEGTFRTMDEDWRKEALIQIKETAMNIGKAMGVAVEVTYVNGYPALINDNDITALSKKSAIEYLGANKVVDLDIWMASEDFSFYLQQVSGCFYRLGTSNVDKGITDLVHTPGFDIDEDALAVGSGLMAYLAIQQLSQPVDKF